MLGGLIQKRPVVVNVRVLPAARVSDLGTPVFDRPWYSPYSGNYGGNMRYDNERPMQATICRTGGISH